MAYITLYFADTDLPVSEAGVFDNPVEFTLRADLNEQKEMRLYAKADAGFQVTETEVFFEGVNANKWAFAPDAAGAPGTYLANGARLDLEAVSEPKYFWVRAEATDDEQPVNDTTVTIEVEGIAEAL